MVSSGIVQLWDYRVGETRAVALSLTSTRKCVIAECGYNFFSNFYSELKSASIDVHIVLFKSYDCVNHQGDPRPRVGVVYCYGCDCEMVINKCFLHDRIFCFIQNTLHGS